MRFSNAIPSTLIAAFGALVPIGACAAGSPATNVSLDVTTSDGPRAVRVTGVVAGAQHLQAVLYASFAPDLPVVFLNRRPLATDATGHFDAIISIAPANLPGAIVTVIVQTAAAVPVARASIVIIDPNVFLPAHNAP
jgi:hypothetical protein